MDYITVKEAAEKWNVSLRTVQQLCVNGRIEGAKKLGSLWMIPVCAEKPGRMKKNKDSLHTPGRPKGGGNRTGL